MGVALVPATTESLHVMVRDFSKPLTSPVSKTSCSTMVTAATKTGGVVHEAVDDHCSEPLPIETQVRRPCKNNVGWRRIVRNFTPSWFAVNMGTGIVSILLHNLPYNALWIRYVSYVFFCANVLLFVTFSLLTVARYSLYPEIWPAMIAHPGQSLFLGCFPMGFATIINMMALVGRNWGSDFAYLVWGFWWFDAVVSMTTCIGVPFVVMRRHNPDLQRITAALLLPIVPTVVAAASGGIVADILPDPGHAFTTLVVSYILWGIGISFSACTLAVYFQRLAIHSLPAKEVIVSVFLPIGPMGQGGFGIQQLGKVALKVLPQTKVFGHMELGGAKAGQILYILGAFIGTVMWAFGMMWLAFAVISIIATRKFPFNMGWWGFTFPIGVLATCTTLLAENLDSEFFKVASTILSLLVVTLWAVVAVKTTQLVMTGEIFVAPCLKDVNEKIKACNGGKKA